MREIKLSKDKVAIVDEYDFESVNKFKWSFGSGYARRAGRKEDSPRVIYMHRYIMKPPPGYQVDHINGNRLDNRRENLRIVTSQQNQWNMGSASGKDFKGVYFAQKNQTWCATITVDGRSRTCTGLKTAETAARIYDIMATDAFGEYARLNFDDSQSSATIAALNSELAEAKRRWDHLENQRLMEEKAARELNQKIKAEVEELKNRISGLQDHITNLENEDV